MVETEVCKNLFYIHGCMVSILYVHFCITLNGSKLQTRAENFRMVDIKSNAKTPGFTKPEVILIRIRYPRKKFKIQPISVSC